MRTLDGFMETLVAKRTDLAGLEFTMGKRCRTNADKHQQFKAALEQIRMSMAERGVTDAAFWESCSTAFRKAEKENDRQYQEHSIPARIAALMQVLAPESAELRTGLAKHLAMLSHPDASRALSRLAIFSAEPEVQNAAMAALKVRRERDYTDVLLQGLRYPWPAVAGRAARAIATLERSDLIPQLISMLEASRSSPSRPWNHR